MEHLSRQKLIRSTGHSVDVVHCDVSKGFGAVPHKRLLAKCERMGIRGEVGGGMEWNALPDGLKTQPTVNCFNNAYDYKS